MENLAVFLSSYPLYQLILLMAVVVMFVIQICYWFSYAQVAIHRHPFRCEDDDQAQLQGVSVIVVVNNEYDYLNDKLPDILSQDYPNFEVIAINDCGGEQMDMALAQVALANPNFRFTTIRQDKSFKHSRKIPLLVGIKAARYENLIFVHTDAVPVSDRWLRYMMRGFRGGSLVIGYCGIERGGIGKWWMRCSVFLTSVRYLRRAISDKAYRGTYNNMGYTKSLFFSNKGFTHLNMTCGEDDLFVQKVATRDNTSVIINPHCSMRQSFDGGFGRWFHREMYRTYAYRYYPEVVKFKTFMELFTRCSLWVLTVTLVVLSALSWLSYAAVGMYMLREYVMARAVRRIGVRLGEKRLVGWYLVYDFLSPVYEIALGAARRIWPPSNLYIKGLK